MTAPTVDDLLRSAEWLDANEGGEEERTPLARVAVWLRAEAARRDRAKARATLRRRLIDVMERKRPGFSKTPQGKAMIGRQVSKALAGLN
jgi:hypothetical protein